MTVSWRVIQTLVIGVALAGAVVPDAGAQRLGRLFTTTDERAQLDAMRLQAAIEKPQPAPDPEPEAPVPVATADPSGPSGPSISRLVINGVVRRNRGPSSVWVNGDLVERGGISREGVTVESARTRAGSVRLRLPSGAGTVALRPGQQIDIDSGTLLEAYEQRASGTSGSAFRPAASVAPVASPAPGSGDLEPLPVPSSLGLARPGSSDR